MSNRDLSILKNYYNLENLLQSLHTNLENGIDEDTLSERIHIYGKNELPPPIMKSFIRFLLLAMKEPMVVLLLGAAGITVAVGVYETISGETNAWLEGVAILVAIAIITGVNSVNDHRKQARFRKLSDTNKGLRTMKVVRNGNIHQIPISNIVTGDIVTVSMGDIMPCDGILLTNNAVKTDESSLTGESKQIVKDAFVDNATETPIDPFIYSGTTVVNGNGLVLVFLVGEESNEGRMMKDVRVDPPPTPLQIKLGKLAKRLATISLIVGAIVLVFLVIIYFLKGSPGDILEGLVSIILVGISILIMGIPEGLPLSVTLALAYATIHMLKDNNLVRHLSACETMGGATTVCSDKTGTLTVNKMTVVKARIFDTKYSMLAESSRDTLLQLQELEQFKKFSDSIMINTDAYEAEVGNKSMFLGSQTEIALLEWLRLNKTVSGEEIYNYQSLRKSAKVIDRKPFNSESKRSEITVQLEDGTVYTYMKGASEVVLSLCNRYVTADGAIADLDNEKRESFQEEIKEYARSSLRTICCAYKQKEAGTTGNDFILAGLFGLEDPLRPNAFESVKQCQRAGIVVRMVTGDNAVTARSIATQCGIVTSDDDIVIEGPRFREMTSEEVQELIPKLRVMARSSPNDKLLLVKALMKANETVAVTGDGANDAPALKNSHVGFSMGISGTEVAKEASDIVLLDDNFSSIVRAILWGRAIYMGIQKFIMFQLSVNVSAVLITIVTSIDSALRTGIATGGLTTLQILLINLIGDSLAAMALVADKPVNAFLDRKPHRQDDHIITGDMWRMIIAQAFYQITVGLLIYYIGPSFFGNDPDVRGTMLYATFVFMIIFNELNCRSVNSDLNIFRGIFKNKFFLPLFIIGFVAQFFVVTYLGVIFNTVPISITMWIVAIALGSGSLFIGVAVRLVDRLFPET